MKSNTSYIIFEPKLIFYLGFVVLLSPSMLGQFYVSNHDLVYVEEKLSIQEQFIYINSHVHGNAQLVFNAEQEQVLFTKENIQLPSLAVHNTSQFTIYSAITINGDLNITAGRLQLHNRIILNGKLYQGNNAIIECIAYIIHHTHIKPQPSPLSIPQNHWTPEITNTHFFHTSNQLLQTQTKPKRAFFYTSTTPHRLAISIPTPPPEYRG